MGAVGDWKIGSIGGLETRCREGIGPTILVVPGMLADYQYPLFVASKVFRDNPILAFNFAGHTTSKEGVKIDESIVSNLRFTDEMDQLAEVARTIKGDYLTLSFSHGFLVDGFAYNEGRINPTKRIGLSPILSRKDWLDIANLEYEKGGKISRFGPYETDRVLDITKVDFRGDTRVQIYDAGKTPVVALHGLNDEYFYDPQGNKWGSNDIDKFTGEDVRIIKVENEGHVFTPRGLISAVKGLKKYLQ